MFLSQISGSVSQLVPNDQTRFNCLFTLSVPLDLLHRIQPGTLVAVENLFHSSKTARYTILQLVHSFPVEHAVKKTKVDLTLTCGATPIGIELTDAGAKSDPVITAADTYPAPEGHLFVLDDKTTMSVIHQIAPESRTQENGSRIDVGTYATNPDVRVGLDSATLMRGNIAIVSARPRARTTIITNLLTSLFRNTTYPLHVVYCDVNNQGTLSLMPLLTGLDNARVLGISDKFIPSSIISAMKQPADRSAHKRATLDYVDMMILPSVLEQRRHDFSYAVSMLFRANKVSIYRPNEQTIDQFVNDIRIDILDGVDAEIESYIGGLMNGIAETYAGERFGEKNTRDILEMIDEFSQDSKSHAARRTLYDLRAEIQSVFESYSKDIPAAVRTSQQDVVTMLNDETKSSLLVVQGQKTSDILRFISTLSQALIEERLKRLKIRVPILFIFNNIDEYVSRQAQGFREAGGDRFQDVLQTLLVNGRRHGLGFCLTLESAGSLDRAFARKIQSYFIGPITFSDEPPQLAQLLNVSEELLRPAVNYEDGRFLFATADSPYHRRVPIPVTTAKNTDVLHSYLDALLVEAERRRREFQAQDEERQRKWMQEREERRKREEEAQKNAPHAARHDEGPEAPRPEPTSERDTQRGRRGRDHGTRPTAEGERTSDIEHRDGLEAPSEDHAMYDAPESAEASDDRKDTRRKRGGRGRGGKRAGEPAPQKATPPASESAKAIRPTHTEQHSLTIETTRSGGYDIGDDRAEPHDHAGTEQHAETGEPAADQQKHASRGRRGRRGGKSSKKATE